MDRGLGRDLSRRDLHGRQLQRGVLPPWTGTFVLRCGVEYNFAGWWEMDVLQMMSIPEPPYFMCMMAGTCGGYFQPTTFIDEATPTRSTS